uniref:DEAD box helicase 3, Y-linked n=1 Tax=Mus musculus TaxID=10090 RepID=A0A087WQV7_MOUSE
MSQVAAESTAGLDQQFVGLDLKSSDNQNGGGNTESILHFVF